MDNQYVLLDCFVSIGILLFVCFGWPEDKTS